MHPAVSSLASADRGLARQLAPYLPSIAAMVIALGLLPASRERCPVRGGAQSASAGFLYRAGQGIREPGALRPGRRPHPFAALCGAGGTRSAHDRVGRDDGYGPAGCGGRLCGEGGLLYGRAFDEVPNGRRKERQSAVAHGGWQRRLGRKSRLSFLDRLQRQKPRARLCRGGRQSDHRRAADGWRREHSAALFHLLSVGRPIGVRDGCAKSLSRHLPWRQKDARNRRVQTRRIARQDSRATPGPTVAGGNGHTLAWPAHRPDRWPRAHGGDNLRDGGEE